MHHTDLAAVKQRINTTTGLGQEKNKNKRLKKKNES